MPRGKGYGAIAAGFVLLLVGFGVLIYELWTAGVNTTTLESNYYVWAGGLLAALGIAVGAVGLDRGIEVKG
jgi:hypothetical protein